MSQEEYTFGVTLEVNRVLTEPEKTNLMIALKNAVQGVLGVAKSGLVLVHSDRREEPDHSS